MLLIIERDQGFASKLKNRVNITGLKTMVVESVADAMFLLESMKANLLLANLATFNSPGEIDIVLDHATKRQTPILFIEGFPDSAALAEHARSRHYGAFITLPFNSNDLVERLKLLRAGDDPLIGKSIGHVGHEIEIVRKLGKGAMGAVYEGYEVTLDRRVAVKFLITSPTDGPEIAQRFRHEARAVAQIKSTHIVAVHSVGTYDDIPYLVMEYVDGPTLATHLAKKGKLESRDALRIVRQILLGLAEAHTLGLVHRDLKPANVMIDRQGRPIILDFGLVRDASGENLTRAGMILGTPRYISPEQVQGRNIDQRTDLYAVGIMLFEMLTGKPPFSDKDHMVVLMKHINEPLPHPESLGSQIEDGLFEIIKRLSSKQPVERFQNASEAIDAIEEHLVAAGHTSVMRGPISGNPTRISGKMTMAGPNASPSSSRLSTTSPTSFRAVRSISLDSKPVPQEVVEELLNIYAEFLGPLAKRLAEKDTRNADIDLSLLPSSSWSDLLNLLATRITDETKRDAFIDSAVLLRGKF